jgi:hypothetical protein
MDEERWQVRRTALRTTWLHRHQQPASSSQEWLRSAFLPALNFPLSVLTFSYFGQVKNAVDAAIAACSDPFDLLGAIENARQQAEDSEGETRERWIAKGVRELRSVEIFLLTISLC